MDWTDVLETDIRALNAGSPQTAALLSFIEENELPYGTERYPDQENSESPPHKLVLALKHLISLQARSAREAAAKMAEKGAVSGGPHDLLDQLVELERENKHQADTIAQLRAEGGGGGGGLRHQDRYYEDEVANLHGRLEESQRLLVFQKSETQRLKDSAEVERGRSRELERQLEQCRQNLEDHRRQLEWQQSRAGPGGGASSSSSRRLADSDFRDRLRKKDHEIAEQLDKIEELLNTRDSLERQLQELTQQLGHVEEQRLQALKDGENLRSALVEADARSDGLQVKSDVLEGQVADLQDRLAQQSHADDHIMALVSSKAQEWESVLAGKQTELDKVTAEVGRLQGQLRATQRGSQRAAVIRIKKQLEERDDQLSALQAELSEATHTITTLTSQLEAAAGVGARRSGTAAAQGGGVFAELDALRVRLRESERETASEVQRREQAEVRVEEKDSELTKTLARLGEYERGEYGLQEAVQEIKRRKEEIAIRDKDIAELTQSVNRLEIQSDQLCEENEALREQLGLDPAHLVDLSPLRSKQHQEIEELKRVQGSLQRELEQLAADKLALRKQLLGGRAMEGGRRRDDMSSVQDLSNQIADLRESYEAEKIRSGVAQSELEAVRRQLQQCREQLEGGGGGGGGGGGTHDVMLQLKSEVSRLTGQTSELRAQLSRSEQGRERAARELERRTCEMERLQQEVESLKQHQRSSSVFQPLPLPSDLPPSSSEVIVSLNEQLLLVMRQLQLREKEVAEAGSALERMQRKFAVIIHQQGILYKEYGDSRHQWEEEKAGLCRENAELTASRDEQRIRLQELKSLQESLAGGEEGELKQRLAELSRKVTVLRVNEDTLARRYSLLQEAEGSLRKENGRLRKDMASMEKAVTERMGYLQRYKETAIFKLSSLQQQLIESVPQSELSKANAQYSELVTKYQHLLQQQSGYVASEGALQRAQTEARTLTEQLESVKQELAVEKLKSGRVRVGVGSGEGGEEGEGEVVTGRVATLEMKELNERQRADLASVRCKQLQETVLQLETRNASLEEKFSELTQQLLQTQSREAQLRDQLACCLPEEEKAALESRIEDLKKAKMHLQIENSQLKDVSEIARQQAVTMETWQKSHDLELSSLRHQLLDVAMRSEEGAVVGRLHHQLVALQVSEAGALRGLEEANRKVLKLEAALLRCERERDDQGEAVFRARADSHRRVAHLRSSLQALRSQCVGSLPLSRQEEHAALVAALREDQRQTQQLRDTARQERLAAQEKLAELELQHSNLQELMAALKDTRAGAVKLTDWHSQLGEARLAELRLQRGTEALRSRVQHLEGRLAHSDGACSKLEQELVQLTKERDSAQLSWEQREAELEQQLEGLRSQPSADPHTAADSASRRLPGSVESGGNTTDLKAQVRKAGDQVDRLSRALNKAQNELLKREGELATTKLQLASLESRQHQADSPHSAAELAAKDRSLSLAQDTITQLKTLASQKEGLADKYQQLLQRSRVELEAATKAHREEVAALVSQLNSHTDHAFSQFKAVALETVNAPPPELPTNKQLARLQELEEVVLEQESANSELARQLQRVKQDAELEKAALHSRMDKLRREMEEKSSTHKSEMQVLRGELQASSSRATELEQEVEVLEGELSASQQAAKVAPTRTMKSLVERLRSQLSAKEKQHRALSQALLQVRSDLLETTQSTLEGAAAAAAGREKMAAANLKAMVDKRTAELQERVQQLNQRLDKLKLQLSDSQAREEASREEHTRLSSVVARLEGEVGERGSQVGRLESECQQRRRALELAKTREQKLSQQIQELQHGLEHSAEVEELSKRVRVLQGRLERKTQQLAAREKQQQQQEEEEVARPALRAVPGSAGKGGVDTSAFAETSSLVDYKHHSEEVVRWEEGKRWQRKVETLRGKLSERHKQLDASQKMVTSLKETLARSDREKNLLQGKLKSTQKAINDRQLGSHDDHVTGRAMPADERHVLKSRIFELEQEQQSSALQWTLGPAAELNKAKQRNSQLLKTVETLELQLQQQSPGVAEQLQALRQREGRLQDELLQCQKENMRLEFQCEQATSNLPRLQAHVKELQDYIELLRSGEGGNTRAVPGKSAPPPGRSVAELERVVAAMRKVVERLQSENEALRKTNQRNAPHKTVTDLEAENKRLKNELERLVPPPLRGPSQVKGQLTPASPGSDKSPFAKITAENDRLRKELKREVAKTERLQLAVSSLELQRDQLQQQSSGSSDSLAASKRRGREKMGAAAAAVGLEEKAERLQAELEKKTAMLMEVKTHLREAAQREREITALTNNPQLSSDYLAVVGERDALKGEVGRLRTELDAFDPAFFEEIEDLKFNYQEAVRKVALYEERMTQLSQEFGFSMPNMDEV